MIQNFLKRQGSGTLVIFFAGWGMDMKPFLDYGDADHDIMICYDYSDMSFDSGMICGYDRYFVMGWSMGVWAATAIMQRGQLPSISDAVAVNGTPTPVDDSFGIPEKIFSGTLESLSDATLVKFRRRMCGDAAGFSFFMDRAPERTVDDLRNELAAIGRMSSETGLSADDAKAIWKRAVICKGDRIFPPQNQTGFWENAGIENISCEGAHYNDSLMRNIIADFGK